MPYYCAQASLQSGETCFGTAVNADIWILIECPEPWGRDAVKDSSMPQAVKDHLAGLSRASRRIRVQLIKQESRTEWPHHVFVGFTRQTQPYLVSFRIDSYDDLMRLVPDDVLNGSVPFEDHPVAEPIHIVCTHGRHDKCCAKFGFATYKFMHGIAPGNVWQTSHTGGDRFASNVISFPTGVYYGHVDEVAAMAIITAESRSEIYLENYRGRTCFGTHGQVAEYFVRKESGISKAAELRREWVRPNEDKTKWTGLFLSQDGRKRHLVTFEQRRASFKALLTCHATEERSPTEYQLLSYSESDASVAD